MCCCNIEYCGKEVCLDGVLTLLTEYYYDYGTKVDKCLKRLHLDGDGKNNGAKSTKWHQGRLNLHNSNHSSDFLSPIKASNI